MFILKQLRRKKNLNQTDLAHAIGVSLRTIQLYEKKDANIPIKNLTKIAQYFDVSIAELYSHEVNEEEGIYDAQQQIAKKGHAVTPFASGKFLITVPLVSVEKQKAYALGHDNKDFLETLVRISFVVEHIEESDYLSFEIIGNSMDNGSIDGIPNKSIVLGKLVSKKKLKKAMDKQYPAWVIVYKDGILCKEIIAYDEKNKTITCHSLNSSPEYSDFNIDSEDIVQLFAVLKKQVN